VLFPIVAIPIRGTKLLRPDMRQMATTPLAPGVGFFGTGVKERSADNLTSLRDAADRIDSLISHRQQLGFENLAGLKTQGLVFFRRL
jgi:hypothetical protein